MTTKEIMALRARATRYARTLYVTTFSGEFGGLKPKLDPYLLGALLGDGGLTKNVVLTSMDKDIVARVRDALPKWHYLVPATATASKSTDYHITSVRRTVDNEVLRQLREWGLMGSKSEQKFVPVECFQWSSKDRWALLQGLMDTDGTIDKRKCSATFSSSSKHLIDGVRRLVHSLGGKASAAAEKQTSCLLHYRLTITIRSREQLFFVERKRARAKPYTTHNPENLRFVSIDYVGDKPCQCISVTHPTKMYVTDDYIPTHNTWFVLWMAMHAWANQGKVPLFVSMEIKPLQIAQRLLAIQAQLPAKELRDAKLTSPQLKHMKSLLMKTAKGEVPFHIVDGNLTANVGDIYALTRQLKPDLVIIDGAYLLQHPTERDRFKRVAENADLLKKQIADLAPTITSWQFARPPKLQKGQKKTPQTLDDIGYSDAIGQHSSLALALQQPESAETMKQRVVSIIKGRNGEEGSFNVNWNFEWTTDFSEVMPDHPDNNEELYVD